MESAIDIKINKLIDGPNWGIPLRLLIISPSHLYYAIYDKSYNSFTVKFLSRILRLSLSKVDRGQILNEFAKLEFLMSQIVLASLVSYSSIDFRDDKQINKRNFILDSISFEQKIRYIKEKLFTPEDRVIFEKSIYKLRDIRNSLAHSIDDKYLEYKGVFLSKNIDTFCSDLEEVGNLFLDMYSRLRNQEGIVDYLLQCVEDRKKEVGQNNSK